MGVGRQKIDAGPLLAPIPKVVLSTSPIFWPQIIQVGVGLFGAKTFLGVGDSTIGSDDAAILAHKTEGLFSV